MQWVQTCWRTSARYSASCSGEYIGGLLLACAEDMPKQMRGAFIIYAYIIHVWRCIELYSEEARIPLVGSVASWRRVFKSIWVVGFRQTSRATPLVVQ